MKFLLTMLLLISLQACVGAGKNSAMVMMQSPKNTAEKLFPQLEGTDLQGNKRQLPQSFNGKLNIVVFAFNRDQQIDVDSWIKVFDQISLKNSQINFYEVPLSYELSTLSRWWVNNGMCLGIQDKLARNRTITVYTDRDKFFAMTKMNAENIFTLLVDKSGKILWQNEGPTTPESIKKLQNLINSYKSNSNK